jgi:hypothetical protein
MEADMADFPDSTTAPEIDPDRPVPPLSDQWTAAFETAHAGYCEAQSALSECQKINAGVSKLRKCMNRRDDSVWAIIRARTPSHWMLVVKINLLLQLMEEMWTGSARSDARSEHFAGRPANGEAVMSKLIDAIDELNRGCDFVRAAYMAAHDLEPDEANAMARVLGAAEDSLEKVKASLEAMLRQGSETAPSTTARSDV